METQGRGGTQVRTSRPLSCESRAVPVGPSPSLASRRVRESCWGTICAGFLKGFITLAPELLFIALH